jgi:hypothetical protein
MVPSPPVFVIVLLIAHEMRAPLYRSMIGARQALAAGLL